MIDRPFTDEERYARAMLAYFTPEKPFMVGQAVYDAMVKEPALADMMDRVKLYPDLPKVDVVRCRWCGTNTLLNGCFCDADVDMTKPEAWDFLRSVARDRPIVIISSAPTPPSWTRDLWDFPHTVIHESPPCAFSAAGMITMLEHDPRDVERELFIRVEKMRPEMEFVGWNFTPDPIEFTGKLTMEELREALAPMEREPMPNARRYGPYDADPHLKGRRRRFRKQRKT